MKKEIALIATAALAVTIFAAGNTLAFLTDKGEVNNVVTMGNVAIELKEPQFESSTGGKYSVEFMPGDKITEDPTVKNVGLNDAYIRCKISVENVSALPWGGGLTSQEQDQLLQALNIDSNKWVRSSDGYYYYQQPLLKAASGQDPAVLFDTVQIPTCWGSSSYPINNVQFHINISAEAIQADNFKPSVDHNGKIDGWNYSNGSAVQVESSHP